MEKEWRHSFGEGRSVIESGHWSLMNRLLSVEIAKDWRHTKIHLVGYVHMGVKFSSVSEEGQ